MQNWRINNRLTPGSFFCLLAMMCFWMGFSSCSKTGSAGNGIPNRPSQPLQLPLGEAVGEVASASIGSAGGALTSKDGTFTIEVPAGAVAATTVFSIQEVSSVLKNNARTYRLMPESVDFKQPVKLVYNYNGLVSDGVNPDHFFLAYQNNNGYFYSANRTKGDRQRQTLTVTTTHFSDWTFYNQYDLLFPGRSLTNGELRLLQGEEATIELRATPIDNFDEEYGQIQLPDLTGSLMVQKAIWDYSPKKGTLTMAAPGSAVYKAPAKVDGIERVFINITINGNLGRDNLGKIVQQMQIRQQVVVMPEGYFTLSENGAEIAATDFSGEYTPALGSQLTASFPNGYQLICYIDGGIGSFPYDMPFIPGKAHLQLVQNEGKAMLVYRAKVCDDNNTELFFSPGAFIMKSVASSQGAYFEGEFTVTVFGYDYCESGRTKSLSGKFKFRN